MKRIITKAISPITKTVSTHEYQQKMNFPQYPDKQHLLGVGVSSGIGGIICSSIHS
jgi:hypothetical protein